MRDKKILQALIQCDSYLSLENLSDMLHVSSRTIANDIKYLIQIGDEYGFSMKVRRGHGYYLEIQDSIKLHQYINESKDDVILDSKERVAGIISLLLLKKDYITQDAIAEKFQVSKSIIKADMGKVMNYLFEHHILLEKKAHFGVRISTRSLHRKELMQKLYEEQDPYVVEQVDQIIKANFKEIEKMMIALLKQYQLSTNYNELKKIDAFLKVSMYAHKHGLYEDIPFKESDTICYQIAKQLGDFIADLTGIKLQESELHDLGVYINKKTKNIKIELVYSEQLKEDMEVFLSEADEAYRTKFNNDQQFKASLLAHVSLLLDRLHQSMSFTNPLVKEISAKYPVIFNLAIKFTNMLEKRYHVHVTQDEIGFIATHFAVHMEKEARDKLSRFNRIAVLCSSGGGSAFLIKLKLESLFTSSQIKTFSLFEQEEVNQFHPDVIFTITDLEETYDVPIIRINELLDDNDILKIKNMFALSNEVTPYDMNILSLFKKECFHIISEPIDYLELLKKMADQLEEYEYAEKGYKAYVLEREQFLSTIYNFGVAMPHPIEMCGKQNIVNVAVVKADVNYDGKQPKIIFMVSLKKSDMELHQSITRLLFEVMSDERSVEGLRDALSFEDFMLKMKEHI